MSDAFRWRLDYTNVSPPDTRIRIRRSVVEPLVHNNHYSIRPFIRIAFAFIESKDVFRLFGVNFFFIFTRVFKIIIDENRLKGTICENELLGYTLYGQNLYGGCVERKISRKSVHHTVKIMNSLRVDYDVVYLDTRVKFLLRPYRCKRKRFVDKQ